MTAYLIGAAELARMSAGHPGVVAAGGMDGLDALSLIVLRLNHGVLRQAGGSEESAMPLPDGVLPLAILALDDATAEHLAAGLPAGIPRMIGPDFMPALLARLVEALALQNRPQARPVAELPKPASVPDLAADMAPSGADFQDVRFYQHTVNADGSYSHIDLGLIGLASAAGIWRETRLKLLNRRGVIGVEIRSLTGWPRMFEVWPKGGSDRFGPFWRLETQETLKSLEELASLHDRVLIAAILGVLPHAVRLAADMAKLPTEKQQEWADCGKALAAAVAAAVGPAGPARVDVAIPG